MIVSHQSARICLVAFVSLFGATSCDSPDEPVGFTVKRSAGPPLHLKVPRKFLQRRPQFQPSFLSLRFDSENSTCFPEESKKKQIIIGVNLRGWKSNYFGKQSYLWKLDRKYKTRIDKYWSKLNLDIVLNPLPVHKDRIVLVARKSSRYYPTYGTCPRGRGFPFTTCTFITVGPKDLVMHFILAKAAVHKWEETADCIGSYVSSWSK